MPIRTSVITGKKGEQSDFWRFTIQDSKLVFDIDIKHFATASKDRTGLFMEKPSFIINENTGKEILQWCNSGITLNDAINEIRQSKNIEQLKELYEKYQYWKTELKDIFINQKNIILQSTRNINPQKQFNNGITSNIYPQQ